MNLWFGKVTLSTYCMYFFDNKVTNPLYIFLWFFLRNLRNFILFWSKYNSNFYLFNINLNLKSKDLISINSNKKNLLFVSKQKKINLFLSVGISIYLFYNIMHFDFFILQINQCRLLRQPCESLLFLLSKSFM